MSETLRRLVQCEQVIDRGLQTFREVGMALAEIRDARLYREAYETFEEYCQTRWALGRSRAYQLMEAADAVSNMLDTGELPLPSNARQAAELARAPKEDRADVWREANERTEGKPTARAIREVREERQRPEPEPVMVNRSTGEIVDEPHEHAEDDARRDDELNAELADTAQRFRRNLSATIARADDVWQFDPDRIAEVYAVDYEQAIRPFLQEMTAWCERVDQAHKRHRSGFRVVQGGLQ